MRNHILTKIAEYYVPFYGNRFFYQIPETNNPSPIPERAEKKRIALVEKRKKQNPGKWIEGFDFSTLDGEQLVEAFERIVRVSTKQM